MQSFNIAFHYLSQLSTIRGQIDVSKNKDQVVPRKFEPDFTTCFNFCLYICILLGIVTWQTSQLGTNWNTEYLSTSLLSLATLINFHITI